MGAAYDAVVAGHLCLDVIPDLSAGTPEQVAALFQPGNLSSSNWFIKYLLPAASTAKRWPLSVNPVHGQGPSPN